jgi:RHH-type rel operon transcriptional repressor/antitoxin RelB
MLPQGKRAAAPWGPNLIQKMPRAILVLHRLHPEAIMLAVRIPDEMELRLEKLAVLTGRPKSFYVREALQSHLDEIEDTYTALYRLEHPSKRWSLEDLERGLDQKG